MIWLVVIDGAGDYQDYFNVLRIEAPTAQRAVEIVAEPGMGYGREVAFVVDEAHVQAFTISSRTQKRVEPSTVAEQL